MNILVVEDDAKMADLLRSGLTGHGHTVDIAPDGLFQLRFGPGKAGRNHFTLGAGSSMLLVREVYSDWSAERRGTISIRRADRAGGAPPPADASTLAKIDAILAA